MENETKKEQLPPPPPTGSEMESQSLRDRIAAQEEQLKLKELQIQALIQNQEAKETYRQPAITQTGISFLEETIELKTEFSEPEAAAKAREDLIQTFKLARSRGDERALIGEHKTDVWDLCFLAEFGERYGIDTSNLHNDFFDLKRKTSLDIVASVSYVPRKQ